MHLTCEKCGETKAFFAKHGIGEYYCECGEVTYLDEGAMRRMYVNCECGNSIYYWTNTTEGIFDINCIDCGAPVPITWNNKKKCYETIRSQP